jgi:hypothetical protein
MKAMAVVPGKPNSIHLADLPEPSVDDIPDGRGFLVEVLRVGVDGTDTEINDAEYGAAPKATMSWLPVTSRSDVCSRWGPTCGIAVPRGTPTLEKGRSVI